MNPLAIGVAGALLVGGAATYGLYQVVNGETDRRSPATQERAGTTEQDRPADRAALETAQPRRARGLREDATLPTGVVLGRPRSDGEVDQALRDASTSSDWADATEAEDDAASTNARFATNRRFADKPDQGGYAANTRQIDKPDTGGYAQTAKAESFDPCVKADGTRYVGPGTAINAFAPGDPCLPRATATDYQIATLADPGPLADRPVTDPAASVRPIVPVDVDRPTVRPPPLAGTGSDYRS